MGQWELLYPFKDGYPNPYSYIIQLLQGPTDAYSMQWQLAPDKGDKGFAALLETKVPGLQMEVSLNGGIPK
jgi:hypothetical protein